MTKRKKRRERLTIKEAIKYSTKGDYTIIIGILFFTALGIGVLSLPLNPFDEFFKLFLVRYISVWFFSGIGLFFFHSASKRRPKPRKKKEKHD